MDRNYIDQKQDAKRSNGGSTFIAESLEALEKYFPDWNVWNSSSDAQDVNHCVITIPPTFDLLKRFVGPRDCTVDGRLDEEQWKRRKIDAFIAGDDGELIFFHAMQQSKIGGILIAGLKLSDILADKPMYIFCGNENDDQSFARRLQQDHNLYEKVIAAFRREDKHRQQGEVDFLFLHPVLGVILIEVKHSNYDRTFGVDDDGSVNPATTAGRKALEQLQRGRTVVLRLFNALTGCDNCERFLGGYIAFSPRERNESTANIVSTAQQPWILSNATVANPFALHTFFEKRISHATMIGQKTNFFDDCHFRTFLATLVGSRPDMFISPVKCVLHWNRLVATHEIEPILQSDVSEAAAKRKCKQKSIVKTSRDNKSLSAREVIARNYPQLNADVKFAGNDSENERKIYFTEEQQAAIVSRSTRHVIHGVPGSGKSLILMMRLFVEAQNADEAARDSKLIVVAGRKHQHDYTAFFHENMAVFLRHPIVQYTHYLTKDVNDLPTTEAFQLFYDELTPAQSPTARKFVRGDCQCSFVLSSAYASQHDIGTWHQQGFDVSRLSTHFRGTKATAALWSTLYAEKVTTESGIVIPIGHDFDGITPEQYKFDHIADFIAALRNRIEKLITIDGCSLNDFAIAMATQMEVEAIAERLSEGGKHEFRLHNECTLPPILTNDEFLLLLSDWRQAFEAHLAALSMNRSDASKYEKAFFGFGFILLEARRWPATTARMRSEINLSFMVFIWMLVIVQTYGPAEEGTIALETMLNLRSLDMLTFDDGQYFPRSWVLRNTASLAFEVCYLYAIQCLLFYKFESKSASRLDDYFYGLQLLDTWPKLMSFDDLPSMQYSTMIVLTLNTNYDRTREKLCYADYLSLALSRAQSHVIIFELNASSVAPTEDDAEFAKGIIDSISGEPSVDNLDVDILLFYKQLVPA